MASKGISAVIVPRNLLRSVFATSASSQDTFRLLAPIDLSQTSLFAYNVNKNIRLASQQQLHITTGGGWSGTAERDLQILYSDDRHSRINDLYPSIESNLGGDIEERRARREGFEFIEVMMHSDGHVMCATLMTSLRPGQDQKLIGNEDRCL